MMETRLHAQAKTAPPPSFTPVRGRMLQRKCACGGSAGITGKCEQCDKQRLSLQRSTENPERGNRDSGGVPPIVHEVLRSPGQPLDAETRAFFEPQFGHDFSRVRVHKEARAAESASAINALAYTSGQDLVFEAGMYAPGSIEGRRLLAHELTHVVQQSQMPPTPQADLDVGLHDHSSEHEAETVAEQVSADDPVTPSAESKGIACDTTRGSDAQGPPSLPTRPLAAPVNRVEASAPIVQRFLKGSLRGSSDGPPVDPQKLAEFRMLIIEYKTLFSAGKLSAEEVDEVNQAIAKAEGALLDAERVAGKGSSTKYASGVALAASATLFADDLTGIGVLDDIAIPFTLAAAGVLAIGAVILKASDVEISRTGEFAQDAVAEAIQTIGLILLAQKVGKQARGETRSIVIHLARILGKTVGGTPPDHQEEDPEKNKKHWWDEIKNWLKEIRKKDLSPRQLIRELRKEFSDQQLDEIRQAMREAAKELGEDPPDFPPMVAP